MASIGGGFGRRTVRLILSLGLISVMVGALAPTEASAQSGRPWRRDGTISIKTLFDSNVFRFTDSQKARLGSGTDQFADMEDASDVIIRVGLGGELRRGPSSRRLRIGGGATLDAFTTNTRRTHVTLDAYLAKSLSKRDAITIKVELTPSEFRRNYLSGVGALSAPLYDEGVATSFEGEFMYSRRLIGGSGPDLDVEFGVLGATRAVDGLAWRDRSSLGGRVELDLKINSDVDMKVGVTRSRAFYDAESQPVLSGGMTSLLVADKDFNETKIAGELKFDLSGDTRLALQYERRMRDFLASLGVDPAFGGREDTRNAFGAELRHRVSNRVDLDIGGKYQGQDTFRPAGGSTGDETDYDRSLVTLQLSYHR